MAADADEIRVQPNHLPLVWMLVLTQAAAGGFAMLPFTDPAARPLLAGVALASAWLVSPALSCI
jgi:hypothetical protein